MQGNIYIYIFQVMYTSTADFDPFWCTVCIVHGFSSIIQKIHGYLLNFTGIRVSSIHHICLLFIKKCNSLLFTKICFDLFHSLLLLHMEWTSLIAVATGDTVGCMLV